jgi:hypothetical protein
MEQKLFPLGKRKGDLLKVRRDSQEISNCRIVMRVVSRISHITEEYAAPYFDIKM